MGKGEAVIIIRVRAAHPVGEDLGRAESADVAGPRQCVAGVIGDDAGSKRQAVCQANGIRTGSNDLNASGGCKRSDQNIAAAARSVAQARILLGLIKREGGGQRALNR